MPALRFNPKSEVELGGTGNLLVPPGYQPGGWEGVLITFLAAQKSRTCFSVPRGESPRGTGRLPVPPGGCAAATSALRSKSRTKDEDENEFRLDDL